MSDALSVSTHRTSTQGSSSGSDCGESSSSPKSGKYTIRGANGKTLLVTPWFPQGVGKARVGLRHEMYALGCLMQLTDAEGASRHALRSVVQQAVASVWPEATVKIYGSFAYGLSLPDSALDLVAEGCVDLSEMDGVLNSLASSGLEVACSVVDGSTGFAKLTETSTGIEVTLSFVAGRSTVRQCVAEVRHALARFPKAREVFALARLILRQARCCDVGTGGMSSFAILNMVFKACETCPRPFDTPVLLMHFLRMYADDIPADGLVVQDMFNKDGANVMEGCTRTPQLRAVMMNAVLSLEKWLFNKGTGFRGRTPLSSLLAYDGLWGAERRGTVVYAVTQ